MAMWRRHPHSDGRCAPDEKEQKIKKKRTDAEDYVGCQDAASDRREAASHHSVYLGLGQVRQQRSYRQRSVRLHTVSDKCVILEHRHHRHHHTRCQSRTLGISWTDRVTNAEVSSLIGLPDITSVIARRPTAAATTTKQQLLLLLLLLLLYSLNWI